MQDKMMRKLSDQSNKLFVVVGGNIGSGKTTLTNKLSARLGWKAHYESVTDNPYLSDFYADMKRWSFTLQVYFLTHRFETHQNIVRSPASAIQDRSIYEDVNIFARALFDQGEMDLRDYENYKRLYENMTQFLTPPDLMIFLKRSTPKLIERIKLRNRNYEQSIPEAYLDRLNTYYNDWFYSYNLGKTLIIETDDLDLLESEDDFNYLIKRVFESLDQKEMFASQFLH